MLILKVACHIVLALKVSDCWPGPTLIESGFHIRFTDLDGRKNVTKDSFEVIMGRHVTADIEVHFDTIMFITRAFMQCEYHKWDGRMCMCIMKLF